MYLSTFGGESGLLAAFFAFACDIKKMCIVVLNLSVVHKTDIEL